MLVLSRKTGESIVIGGGIEIRVVQIRGDRVRLGFDAPFQVRIQRCELGQQPISGDGDVCRESVEIDHAEKDQASDRR